MPKIEINLAPLALIHSQWHAGTHIFSGGHKTYAQWERRWWPFVFRYTAIWCTCGQNFYGTDADLVMAKLQLATGEILLKAARDAKRSRTSKNSDS